MDDKKLHSIAEAYKKAFLATYKFVTTPENWKRDQDWIQMDSDGTVYVKEKEKIYITPMKKGDK